MCMHVHMIEEGRPCREGRNLMRRERAIGRRKTVISCFLFQKNLDSKCVHGGCLVRVRGPVERAGEGNEGEGVYERSTRIDISDSAIVIKSFFTTLKCNFKKILRVIIDYPKRFKRFLRIIEHVSNGY